MREISSFNRDAVLSASRFFYLDVWLSGSVEALLRDLGILARIDL
ncbi:protein of unknown function [Methylocaldum szegediense]|uniref:Uncharacterized protein n=1 Tax=Methylocaldum szegediense TaxID=73780 RepID=A0ABM9HYG8_9GAMM|nr:protein of unknown function [Methylocaldum szegediense]